MVKTWDQNIRNKKMKYTQYYIKNIDRCLNEQKNLLYPQLKKEGHRRRNT